MATATSEENCAPQMPANMREVSEADFFAMLKAETRDVMPTTESPYFTPWRLQRTQQMWGWSSTGWKNGGRGEKERYAVVRS